MICYAGTFAAILIRVLARIPFHPAFPGNYPTPLAWREDFGFNVFDSWHGNAFCLRSVTLGDLIHADELTEWVVFGYFRIGTCRKKVMGLLRLMGNKADVVKGLAKRCNENWRVAPTSDIVRNPLCSVLMLSSVLRSEF